MAANAAIQFKYLFKTQYNEALHSLIPAQLQ